VHGEEVMQAVSTNVQLATEETFVQFGGFSIVTIKVGSN
jgi:hypothetical protein